MKGDFSRSTFRREQHYHGVLMQQGRVQLDADWNESLDIIAPLDETTRIDAIGRTGVPKMGGGFGIGIAPDGADLTIDAGRLYVDGLLCELDGSATPATAVRVDEIEVAWLILDGRPLVAAEWIEVAETQATETPVAPQITRIVAVDVGTRTLTVDPSLTATDLTGPQVRRIVSYASQPDLPAPALVTPGGEATPPTLKLEDGTYLVYLDAWLRHITDLDDPEIAEPALGGLDTTTRAKTVAQVRLKYLGADLLDDCAAVGPLPDLFADSDDPEDRQASTGRLSARARPPEESTDICVIPPDARYQGLENQLYRVEVHDPGELGTATFKWSRENGSIAVLWSGQTSNRLAVSNVGRDAVLGFASGQLVELIDDTRELHGRPGQLIQLSEPPGDNELVVPPASGVQRSNFPLNPKIRRWDCDEAVKIEVGANDGYIALEDGVEVRFEPGHYNTGDYWLIPARTATRDVDWPRDGANRPLPLPQAGIAHHLTPLALVQVAAGTPSAVIDCRMLFPPLTAITADDVSFDNESCALPGAKTVQDALDAMCEESTLRRHKKHLHGWGIVCGLQVDCGPNGEVADLRRGVTVRTGYAIDCEGNDLLLDRDEPIDVFDMVKASRDDPKFLEKPGFLDDGEGDLSLFLDSDPERGIRYGIEPYDPNWDKRKWPQLGELINEVYEDCVGPIERFLHDELGVGEGGRWSRKATQRQSILTSLVAQVINPNASQHIYVSRREHEIVVAFYDRLKELLRSETFCAMFDDATGFPEYPADLPDMDTIFGLGHHQRIRLRPGGREAYTVGGGINPIRPSSYVNRYDLEKRELVELLAPIAGVVVDMSKVDSGAVVDKAEPDSGAGAINDVAFSPGGDRIYMVAPTKNEQNTFFRAGRIDAHGVTWSELVTICDVQLVTLATSRADPDVVYAIGSRKGLYRIDPGSVDPSMAPVLSFPASGHLVITPAGRGVASSIQDGGTAAVPTYDRLVVFETSTPGTIALDITLPTPGGDDLAIAGGSRVRPAGREVVYVVTGSDAAGDKEILAFDLARGTPVPSGNESGLVGFNGPLRLAGFAPSSVLLATLEDDCVVELVDTGSNVRVPGAIIPVQVGPVSHAATDEPPFAYVLNYWSDTITVLPADVLSPKFRFPLETLAAYRRQMVLAFRDLLAGFLQYLKDCFCDHLLVDCPDCDGDERIYLASISIRKGGVYKVCNFSRRKYVKSFPTVDRWLSIVPVMPLIQKAVEEFCCMVLPDLFSRYDVPEYDPKAERQAPRFRYSKGRADVETAQRVDIRSRFHDVRTRTTLAASLIGEAGRRTLGERLADPAVRVGNLVDRPTDQVERSLADHRVTVRRVADQPVDLSAMLGDLLGLLRTPREGDDVTLHESAGRVRYFTTASPLAGEGTGGRDPDMAALTRAVHLRDAEVSTLREQVRALEARERAAGPAVDSVRVAALETELSALRGLREQVTKILEAQQPTVAKQSSTEKRAPARSTPRSTSASGPGEKSRRRTPRTRP